MTEKDILKVKEFLNTRNYLGAYMLLKEREGDSDAIEYIGTSVNRIVDDLSDFARDKERVYYLRSILSMFFKEVPGLSAVYREQVRIGTDSFAPGSGIMKAFKDVADLSTGRKTPQEQIEETVEDVRTTIEDAADNLDGKKIENTVSDIFSLAEKGVKEGIKQMSGVIDAISRDRNKRDEDDEDESDKE